MNDKSIWNDEKFKRSAEFHGKNEGRDEESKAKKYVENDAKTEEKMKKIDAEENDANASGRRKGKHF